MQQNLKQEILKVIKTKFGIKIDDIKLTNPPKKEMGDFAFNCGILARDLKKNPAIIAEELIDNLKEINELSDVSADGAFINLKIKQDIYTEKFIKLYKNKDFFTSDLDSNNKTIIIDYIGSNIGKPLHIGHMCTPNQGQTMYNIYKKLGYNVIGDNHPGDWGIIFGKLIFAYKYFGEKKEELEKNAIDYLLKLYIDITAEAEEKPELDDEFRKTFKELSSGNKEYIELWKEFTNYSHEELRRQLKRLNVKPDVNIGESFYEGLDLPKLEEVPDLSCSMGCIVKELIDLGIAVKNDDNSVGVDFGNESKISSCMVQKRDGTHGYFAADLAAIKYRVENWSPEKIIYFTDSRQQLHFRQAFEIARKAGWLSETELFHAYNGFISLKDGAMSTRKGRIIKLDKLLDEAESRAEKIILEKRDDIFGEELKELSRIIGIGAIKYGYLKRNRETDSIFDWDEYMSFEGNSGPYIQYAYVRARKILEKSNFEDLNLSSFDDKGSTGNEIEGDGFSLREEIELVKKIGDYKGVLEKTVKNNYPHILCKYAYELTKIFNSFYNNIHILNKEDESKKILRLKLVDLFSLTLKNSFELLAIEMPEKM